jgi:hypothetical protein
VQPVHGVIGAVVVDRRRLGAAVGVRGLVRVGEPAAADAPPGE